MFQFSCRFAYFISTFVFQTGLAQDVLIRQQWASKQTAEKPCNAKNSHELWQLESRVLLVLAIKCT